MVWALQELTEGPMLLRAAFATSLALFLAVVLSSFAYGIFLLYREPQPTGVPEAPVLGSRNEDLAAQLRAAQQHLQNREAEQAIVAYRRVLAVAPSLEGQLGLAEGELLAGRQDIAAQEFERALRLEPGNPKALLELARIDVRRASKWPQAENCYREYLTQKPDDAQNKLDFAHLLLWQGKATAAVELLAQPGVQQLMSPQDRRDYAFALVKAGKQAQAEPVLMALAAEGADDQVFLQLAGLRASRGDWDSALPLYQSVLKRRPEDAQLNLTVGLGLVALGDTPAALTPLEKAAQAMPDNGEAALGYARALRKAGDVKRASREFERAASKYANDAAVNREYADLLLEKRDYRKAETQYRRALNLGLRDDRLLLALATALSVNDKVLEAIPLLEEVYQKRPSDRLAYDLAKLYQRVGRSDRALELLRTIQPSSQPQDR